MKYYLDFEFIEGFSKWTFAKNRHFIDLISIGLVAEDGREYYAISNEYNYKDASGWVKENVILPMYIHAVHGDARNRYSTNNFHKTCGKSHKQIAFDIVSFVYPETFKKFNNAKDEFFQRSKQYGWSEDQPEFYGYYADYDWVLFCSLFGTMMDLPNGFPMYCHDLKQTLDEKVSSLRNSDFFTKFHIESQMSLDEKLVEIKKHTQYPQQENEHNAIADARWNKKLHEFIINL